MPAHDWNFLAGRLDGDGGVTVVESELPIEIDSIDRNLSAPKTLSGTITNRVTRLRKAGKPILEPNNTIIIAEASGIIRGMGIYRQPAFNGPSWELDVAGFGSYPAGTLYTGEQTWTGAEPIGLFRHVWDHLQGQPGGDLGVLLDRTTVSTVSVGTKEEPYKLTWYDTLDLGSTLDSLSTETPFDWIERDYWDADGQPVCRIDFGFPEIGRVDQQHRLVLGENLETEPSVGSGDLATEVYVYGAGEGRKRIRGFSGKTPQGRVRRVRVIEDTSVKSTSQANAIARQELAASQADFTVQQLDVFDHPNFPLASIELGNQYALYAETEHITVDQFVRVVGISEDPLAGDRATLTVVRSEEA